MTDTEFASDHAATEPGGAERDHGPGAWLAQFHEAGPDGSAPLSATGRFTAAFQNWAAMSGAFGVHRQ